jgi:DNA (cytosine-5)-methyltransferase 1
MRPSVTSPTQSLFPSLDLFAGAGGWDEGIAPLGIRPLGIELDDDACATREAAGHPTLQADVAELDPHDFAPIRLLLASPPCQAFSVAGKGEGHQDVPLLLDVVEGMVYGRDYRPDVKPKLVDHRSLLVVEPLRWALALKPAHIAFEQVPSVLPLWREFASRLELFGYSCWTGVLEAERYGVPQTRERAFLLASRSGQRPEPPTPTHQRYVFGEPAAEEHLLDGTVLAPWMSMADALGWGMSDRPSVTVTAQANRSGGIAPLDGGSGARETIRREQRGGRWVVRTQNFSAKDFRGQRGVRYERPTDAPSPTVTGNTGLWVFDRPATTITCDPRVFQPGGHHEPGKQSENSILVVLEEAAILQGFRVDYPWQGATNKARFQQVGNAVPPPLAQAVIGALVGSELLKAAA